MSFSIAFQSLRLPARSIAPAQFSRSIAAPSASRATSTSIHCRCPPQHTSRNTACASAAQPHAPHGHLHESVAGPSRCFCTSHCREKASELSLEELPPEELPLEELHYATSLDAYRHEQLPTNTPYSQANQASTPIPPPAEHNTKSSRLPPRAAYHQVDTTIASLPPTLTSDHHPQTPPASSCNAFFTPLVRQNLGTDTLPVEPRSTGTQHGSAPTVVPTYIDSLDPTQRESLDHRVRLLIRSGEHSMAALSAEYGELRPEEREQVCCHIMSQLVKQSCDARVVWDLYQTWASASQPALAVQPGPTRTAVRRMQSGALYRCAVHLQAAGLTRQAATVVGDARLKPSQSRYLLEHLIYDLRLPPNLSAFRPKSNRSGISTNLPASTSFAAADARITVREICDVMMHLMAEGVCFKRKTINRTLKLLCLTRARSHVVRLLRAAQRRAQIELLTVQEGSHGGRADELRAAGGFSRLRTQELKPPLVISTKVMEEAIRVLCTQDSTGARTAYELLSALDVSQRSPAMYDALMTVYGNASIASIASIASSAVEGSEPSTVHPTSTSTQLSAGYTTVDEQLWNDICTLPHLGGPTLHTISARIVCHARTRKLDLIKTDLHLLRTSKLGTMHELTENAKLSIVRCYIESGFLLSGYRHASILLSRVISVDANAPQSFQSKVVNTLLHAAQHIHIHPTLGASPSRAQLLKRFLRHFLHLHQRFPQLQPGMDTLALFIQLLDTHQQWIETPILWNMLRVVVRHFRNHDVRLVGVLEAFVDVFESRGERSSADELRGLIGKLKIQHGVGVSQ